MLSDAISSIHGLPVVARIAAARCPPARSRHPEPRRQHPKNPRPRTPTPTERVGRGQGLMALRGREGLMRELHRRPVRRVAGGYGWRSDKTVEPRYHIGPQWPSAGGHACSYARYGADRSRRGSAGLRQSNFACFRIQPARWPSFDRTVPPTEGGGECGAVAPASARVSGESTARRPVVTHVSQRVSPAFPHASGLTVPPRLPGDRAFSSPSLRMCLSAQVGRPTMPPQMTAMRRGVRTNDFAVRRSSCRQAALIISKANSPPCDHSRRRRCRVTASVPTYVTLAE